jgi:hypothetical protein
LGRSKAERIVWWQGELDFGAVPRCGINVWQMLRRRWCDMVETLEGFGNLIGHADVACAVGVLPIQKQYDAEID